MSSSALKWQRRRPVGSGEIIWCRKFFDTEDFHFHQRTVIFRKKFQGNELPIEVYIGERIRKSAEERKRRASPTKA